MIDIEEYERKWEDIPKRPKKFKKSRNKSKFSYNQKGLDLKYHSKYSRDIIKNNELFRIWHPDSRGDENLNISLSGLSKYPDIFPYVAIMPDYHLGENSVNGSVIPSENLLYVTAIGGDIGCGMTFAKLPLKSSDLEGKLKDIYETIYEKVPTGRRINIDSYEHFADMNLFNQNLEVLNKGNLKDATKQMGTLGSGNHFIEVQLDERSDETGVMIHSGSRALGQYIRKMFVKRANPDAKVRGLYHLEADSQEGQNYLKHVDFAVKYASQNRAEILNRVYSSFAEHIPKLKERSSKESVKDLIDVPHNFILRETHFGKQVYVHRKGALYLPEDALGLIPGSMGTSSFIVRGRGNKYSFDSCSHGAGRRLSRGAAFNSIRREDFTNAMGDIISRNDNSILDEAPQAYKPIRDIIKYQKDLIKIQTKLRPLAVVKG